MCKSLLSSVCTGTLICALYVNFLGVNACVHVCKREAHFSYKRIHTCVRKSPTLVRIYGNRITNGYIDKTDIYPQWDRRYHEWGANVTNRHLWKSVWKEVVYLETKPTYGIVKNEAILLVVSNAYWFLFLVSVCLWKCISFEPKKHDVRRYWYFFGCAIICR